MSIHQTFIRLCVAFVISSTLSLHAQNSGAQDASSQGAAQQDTSPQAAVQPADPPANTPGVLAPGKTRQGEDKRVFGVLPNYRTAEMSAVGHTMTAGQKLHIAIKDSTDYPLYLVSAAFAGIYQLEDSHPQFGQGAVGYFRRYGTAYADQFIGNMLTEGFLPIAFREDPRYFRLASGTIRHRMGYALSRVLITRTDSGRSSFNFSEVLGNGIGAGIGLAYYEDNRDFPDYAQNWGITIATDAVSQLGKEFWPDIKRHYFRKKNRGNLISTTRQ